MAKSCSGSFDSVETSDSLGIDSLSRVRYVVETMDIPIVRCSCVD